MHVSQCILHNSARVEVETGCMHSYSNSKGVAPFVPLLSFSGSPPQEVHAPSFCRVPNGSKGDVQDFQMKVSCAVTCARMLKGRLVCICWLISHSRGSAKHTKEAVSVGHRLFQACMIRSHRSFAICLLSCNLCFRKASPVLIVCRVILWLWLTMLGDRLWGPLSCSSCYTCVFACMP